MQLKGNIYFHSWWHYLRDSRCQIVQCLLEASSKFGNWNWLNPLTHFCNFITPYGHCRFLWLSSGWSSAVPQNISSEVKHIEDIMISNKDISAGAVKLQRSADCHLNELIFANKVLSTFSLWGLANQMRCTLIPRPHKTAGLNWSMTLKAWWTSEA